MVVMKAAGLAVAIRVRACREARHESAAGLSGRPYVMLNNNQFHPSSYSSFMYLRQDKRNS